MSTDNIGTSLAQLGGSTGFYIQVLVCSLHHAFWILTGEVGYCASNYPLSNEDSFRATTEFTVSRLVKRMEEWFERLSSSSCWHSWGFTYTVFRSCCVSIGWLSDLIGRYRKSFFKDAGSFTVSEWKVRTIFGYVREIYNVLEVLSHRYFSLLILEDDLIAFHF